MLTLLQELVRDREKKEVDTERKMKEVWDP